MPMPFLRARERRNPQAEVANRSRYPLFEIALGLVTFMPTAWVLTHSSNLEQPYNVAGKVIQVSSEQVLLETIDHSNIVLHLSPKTFVWKQLWFRNSSIAVGDTVRAEGWREADGSLDVKTLFVNIVNLMGSISSIKQEPGGFQLCLQDRFLGSVLVKVRQQTLVRQPFGNRPVELHQGQLLRVIGRKLKDGSVVAVDLER